MAASQATMAMQNLSFKMPLFTARQFSVSSSALRYKRAIMRREERKRRIKFYLPKKKSTISDKVKATINTSNINFAEDEEISRISEKLSLTSLVRSQIRKSSPIVDPGSVYQKRPDIKPTIIGKTPEPRLIWTEKDWPDGFPATPEEAETDIITYLTQKDIFRRKQVIDIPKFCVGSIVAVTRAEPFSPKGSLRFVGICILKDIPEHLLHSRFTLRNIIDNEPIEFNFQLYSPLIQKIEVLKHERRTDMNGKEDLTFLRDYPPEDSTIDENMEPFPYTEEPMPYVPKYGENMRIQKWFKELIKQKDIRRNSKKRRELTWNRKY